MGNSHNNRNWRRRRLKGRLRRCSGRKRCPSLATAMDMVPFAGQRSVLKHVDAELAAQSRQSIGYVLRKGSHHREQKFILCLFWRVMLHSRNR